MSPDLQPTDEMAWVDTATLPVHSFRFGEITVHALRELDVLSPPTRFLPQFETEEWDDQAWYAREPHLTNGRIRLNQQAHLLQTPHGVVLVDTGAGNGKNRAVPAFHQQNRPWLAQLERIGLGVNDVDIVVFTHLHADHVGFATSSDGAGGWVPTFPQARYVLTRQEFEFWTGPSGLEHQVRTGNYTDDSVLPLLEHGVLDLVEPGHRVTPEIQMVAAFGHTPGNVYLEVESAGSTAVFAGDMLHHAIQLAHPEWSIRFCVDGHDSAIERRALLERLADTDTLFVTAHLPAPTAGYVTRDGGAFGIRFIEGP